MAYLEESAIDAPKRKANVNEKINNLEKAISEQESLIETLSSALSFVSQKEGPVPGEAESPKSVSQSYSPLTKTLDLFGARIFKNNLKLQLLLRNLDI